MIYSVPCRSCDVPMPRMLVKPMIFYGFMVVTVFIVPNTAFEKVPKCLGGLVNSIEIVLGDILGKSLR